MCRRDVRGSCRNKVGRCFTRMERGGGTKNEEGEGGSRGERGRQRKVLGWMNTVFCAIR